MPKYTFYCENCGKSKQMFTPSSTNEVECECHSKMTRQLPKIGVQRVTEVVDTYTGVTRDQDHNDLIKQRRDDHYWDVEVERLILTCSVETCIENGWLVYNEKGELVKGKAPHKR